jgi:hypothetical protein
LGCAGCVGWGDLAAVGVFDGVEDGVREGVAGGVGDAAHIDGGDLEAVEQGAGADGVDVVFSERGDEQGDGEGDGVVVFERGEVKGEGLGGCEAVELGDDGVLREVVGVDACGHGLRGFALAEDAVALVDSAVVEAEGAAADGRRAAAQTVGADVTAEEVVEHTGLLAKAPPPRGEGDTLGVSDLFC